MNFATRQALECVIKAGNYLAQRDVAPNNRAAYLELLRLGFIQEKTGSWSGRSYWVTTTAGRRSWESLR